GKEIRVTAEVSGPKGAVTEVEFYNGNVKIGSSSKAPYQVVWKNVPAGSYKLTARAKVDNPAVVVSPPVSVNVKAVAGIPVEEEGQKPPKDPSFSPMYINAGTTVDVQYQGNKYIGDGKTSSIFQNSSTYANKNAISEEVYQTER